MTEMKKLPKSQVEVRVSIPFTQWGEYIEPAVKKLAQQVRVEGFRPGKAPRSVIEQQVGKEAILAEAGEMALSKSWEQVVKEEKIPAIGRPKADIHTLEEGSDLEYTITTSVMPELELKDAWKKAVQKRNARHAKESNPEEGVDAEVEKELKRLAESRAKLVTVSREAKSGDSVLVDFVVRVGGIPIEGGTAKNHTLVLGSGVFIPGFEEHIEGMSATDEKTFELTFPKEYHDKGVAGKKAEFEVKLVTVQERDIPEIDDAFARSLGSFDDLGALRKSIRQGVEEERKHKEMEEKRMAIVEELLKCAEAELPDILVDEELAMMTHDFEQRITSMGLPFEQYLAQTKKTQEDIRESFRENAEKRVLINLIFSEIAERESIDPKAEEVEARMNQTLSRYKDVKDIEKKIDMQRLYAISRGELMNEKVWEMLDNM